MSAKLVAEEFVLDVLKLAVLEAMFHLVEAVRLGALAMVIIVALLAWRHRQHVRAQRKGGTS